MIKFGSLFDGAGTVPFAAQLCGAEAVWASEIEPFPIAVTKKRFPNMKHLGDITKINGADIEPVDVIAFGSNCQNLSSAGNGEGLEGEQSKLFFEAIRIIKEMREKTNGRFPTAAIWENVCFAEDTLVACESGYKKISEIFVGEKVKTASGKFFPVVKTHKTRKSEVLLLKASGGESLWVTPNHPFYARKREYTNGKRSFSDPKWTRADELTPEHMIAYRIDTPTLPHDFISISEAWAIGRYLADGSVDLKKSNPRIFISCGIKKAEETRLKLKELPYQIYESRPHPTAINFNFTSREFYSLVAEVGIGAGNKQVPPFVFALPMSLQKAVLEGYLSGDGFSRSRYIGTEISAATVSRKLAYGIARLMRNVYRVGVNISKREGRNTVIAGREIKSNYSIYEISCTVHGKSTRSFTEGQFVWQPVINVGGVEKRVTVYNLSVLEDNTYGANDIVVHNCGALSIHGGEDFRIVLEEMCRIKDSSATIPRPTERGGGSTWADAGSILADGYSVAWRVLDAQFWGVPQRRRRIYLVADFRGQGAEEILFERAGLSRDFKTISKEWNSSAAASVLCSADTRQCYRQNGEGDGNTVPTLVGDHNNRVNFHTALVCGIDTFNKTETGRVSRTLVTGHQDADGVPCVAFHLLQDPISSFDVAPCISTGNSKTGQAAIGVVYALDRASYNQGKNAQYKISIDEDIAQTVVAKGPGAVCYFSNSSGNGISGTIDAHYYLGCGARSGKEREVVAQLSRDNLFVRRFTPTECGRSQGMPDWWCSDIEHSDAAEYKMWGNGMALPNILYVVENTVRVLQKRRRRAE